MDNTTALRHADTESAIRACWPAVQQLRANLPARQAPGLHLGLAPAITA